MGQEVVQARLDSRNHDEVVYRSGYKIVQSQTDTVSRGAFKVLSFVVGMAEE